MKYQLDLPTFHLGQQQAWEAKGRFTALRAGRRMGKTAMMQAIAVRYLAEGKNVGWFAPSYKLLSEAYSEIREMLGDMITSASQMSGVIRVATGGRIDFWSLENERAGRSRRYHVVMLDEVAFAKNNMMKIWDTAIKPTLLDYRGHCWAGSTPNGIDSDNFFWRICNEPEHEFVDFHAPTSLNPYLPADEIEKLKITSHPLVFKQEYLAEFIDWGGEALLSMDALLVDGQAVPTPTKIDGVFAVMDTAVKGGSQHDGTAIVYFGKNMYHGQKLYILDWDIVQMDANLLEIYLPQCFERLEELALQTGARFGANAGISIEDRGSGTILIQQGKSRGWNVHPIDSGLTSLGKDERAVSVSGYHSTGDCKITEHAYDKVVKFKNATRNHLLSQITTFRLGDPDSHKRADDLLDSFVYGLAIGVGDKWGY
jgi:hypothetical protein